MAVRQTSWRQLTPWIGRGALLLGFAAGVVVIMFWLAGRFSPKVPVSTTADQPEVSRVEGRWYASA